MANKKKNLKDEKVQDSVKNKEVKVSNNASPKENKNTIKDKEKTNQTKTNSKNVSNNKKQKDIKANNTKKSKTTNSQKKTNKTSLVVKDNNKEKVLKEDNKAITKTEVVSEKKNCIISNYTINILSLIIAFFSIEIIFRIISGFDILSFATLRILLSSSIIALIITFVSNLIKKRWLRNTINLVFVFGYTLYAWLQLGFINYLGVYISFNTSSQFGAVTDYIFDYLMSFKVYYYIILLPFILCLIYYLVFDKKHEYKSIKLNLKTLWLIPLLLVLATSYYGTLKLSFMQNELQIKSNISLFKNPNVPTVAVNQFGTTMFGLLDLKSFLFPVDDVSNYEASIPSEDEDIAREVSPYLDDIASNETNKKYVNLNNYFASQNVTDTNEYTGLFEGKNVVVILMESVNEAFINEEYFPNFTSIYNNGWSFVNTYSPRNSCATGNNEFSAMTSLYSIYNTCTSNVYKNNTYFESIFNLFNNKGYTTTSMHDFTEWYYYRSTIHANMGSGKFYGANDLGIKTAGYYGEWPSDVEFFEKAFDILLSDDNSEPWMTWLTTVTSHQPYSSSSTYGDLYKDYFKSLGYSTTVSRYLSKLKVVDEAIGVMIEKLKEAGKWEDTVIVMLADHYPYGLNKTYIKEMISHDLNDYEIEKTPFVIYNAEIEAKTFTQYNSYINLVPTLANLMNLDYDPRLYMGSDLLSEDYESLVVFADGSWKNEIAYYDASTGKIKYYTDEEYTVDKIQEINSKVELKISMSSSAIKNNYFKYLGEKLEEYALLDNKENENVEE